MKLTVKFIIRVTIVATLWASITHAEKAKTQTALAADIWNSFLTPRDLESFLVANKNKSEQATIKKFMGRFNKSLPLAVFSKNNTLQFGSDATEWAIDSDGGIWVDGKLFVAKPSRTLIDTIQQFKKWRRDNVKTSLMNLLVPKAYAADDTKKPDTVESEVELAQIAFLTEFKDLLGKPCSMDQHNEALKKFETKSESGLTIPAKVTSVGIICPDQNPNNDVIYASAHGNNIVVMMSSEFAISPSTGKRYLKRVKFIENDVNRMNMNFIESTSDMGSELHTVELKSKAGSDPQVINQAQYLTSEERKCMADVAQRLPVLIDNVCKNIKVSSYIQQRFGQMTGPAPKKNVPAASQNNK